jgi:hypothetical protein
MCCWSDITGHEQVTSVASDITKLDFMHKTNESKLMIHAYTYTNRAPPIFTECGYGYQNMKLMTSD